MTQCHYNKSDLITALKLLGVTKGDILFSHIGMGFIGYPEEGKSLESMFHVILDALTEVIGSEGTLLIPTYSYSFCRNEIYDVQHSPSTLGYFSERFRKIERVKRNTDPIFSVAGIGLKVDKLFKNLPNECFGKDCIYDRLVQANASICNIGVGFRYATFIHFAEKSAGVPYRYDKNFSGITIDDNGNKKKVTVIYYVRTKIDDKSTFPDLSRLEKDAFSSGCLHKVQVGKGVVTKIDCKDLYSLCLRGIKKDPWYLARGKYGIKQ